MVLEGDSEYGVCMVSFNVAEEIKSEEGQMELDTPQNVCIF